MKQWTASGKVPEAEMDSRLETGSGTVGGGVYVSKSSVDSSSYGRRLMVFEAPQNLHVLKWADRMKLLPHVAPISSGTSAVNDYVLNPLLVRAGVDGSRHMVEGDMDWSGELTTRDKPNWLGMISRRSVSKVREGNLEDALQGWAGPKKLSWLVRLDLSMGVHINELVSQEFPLMRKVLDGTPLLDSERETLASQMPELESECHAGLLCLNSKLYRRIKEALRPIVNESSVGAEVKVDHDFVH